MKKKHTRRDFIKYSSVLGAGIALMPSCLTKSAPTTGIQLYTLRDQMDQDAAATLERVAAIGYNEVESAGYAAGKYYGMKAGEFRQVLNSNGLTMPSGHYLSGRHAPEQKGTLTNHWEQAVEDAAEAGQKYMVCAYLFDSEREHIDDYKRLTDLLNESGEICRNSDIQFCYHNHAFEFEPMGGQVPYDILLKGTDVELVKMELDLYWTEKAGIDPVVLFNNDPGRYPLWHIKDMDNSGDFTAVGTGVVDFKRIFSHRKNAGLEHFFVEQDQISGDAFENVTTSYNNIQNILS